MITIEEFRKLIQKFNKTISCEFFQVTSGSIDRIQFTTNNEKLVLHFETTVTQNLKNIFLENLDKNQIQYENTPHGLYIRDDSFERFSQLINPNHNKSLSMVEQTDFCTPYFTKYRFKV